MESQEKSKLNLEARLAKKRVELHGVRTANQIQDKLYQDVEVDSLLVMPVDICASSARHGCGGILSAHKIGAWQAERSERLRQNDAKVAALFQVGEGREPFIVPAFRESQTLRSVRSQSATYSVSPLSSPRGGSSAAPLSPRGSGR